MKYVEALCAICGISGDEEAVRSYLEETIAAFPDIIEMKTDALGNLLVHKKGKTAPRHTVLLGAHMDEVGLIVTEVLDNGNLALDTVGGIDPEAVIGRAVQIPNPAFPEKPPVIGVIGTKPVHELSAKERDEKPGKSLLICDVGTKSHDETVELLGILPGDSVCFYGPWTPLGGGRAASKAIDDRFGCAALLCMLEGEIPCDAWFGFFVQEEIGLRGSGCAAYAVDPEYSIILETTTAADLDGVKGGAAVCRLGDGPVVSFMDKRTIYDRELYRLAFSQAQALGIPCQTKTRIAGGNDAGAVHLTREGIRTMAISIPCRCLHTPYCIAQESDMEQSLQLAQAMLAAIQNL